VSIGVPIVVPLRCSSISSRRGALCWDLTWGLPERPLFRHRTCFNGSTGVTTQARMGLFQLPNAHLFFAFNGHLVLSPTLSLKIWRRLFIGQWSLRQLLLEGLGVEHDDLGQCWIQLFGSSPEDPFSFWAQNWRAFGLWKIRRPGRRQFPCRL